MRILFWTKARIIPRVCAALVLGVGTIGINLAAAESQPEKKEECKGALAGLPSATGPHIEKITAMGDDTWLSLGAPAPDPKWGRALGRTWSPKMPYAPELRGAFLGGAGNHGWVNPKTNRQMDDYWFYDINTNRWICVYPGTNVGDLDATLILNQDGFTAHKDGEAIPVVLCVHAYECLGYDTDRKRFLCMDQGYGCFYGPAGEWNSKHKSKTEGSPWYFDTIAGKWGRQGLKGSYPTHIGLGDVMTYVPSKKQVFYHSFGSGRHLSYFYDSASNLWTEVKTNWSEENRQKTVSDSYKEFANGDAGACYDSKRDRIYIGKGKNLSYLDVKTNTWVDLKPQGDFNAFSPADAVMNYDSVNDKVTIIDRGGQGYAPDPTRKGKVYIYDPETNTAPATSGTMLDKVVQLNGFYDPILNVHFIHNALDNYEGTMWAYRYKRAKDAK